MSLKAKTSKGKIFEAFNLMNSSIQFVQTIMANKALNLMCNSENCTKPDLVLCIANPLFKIVSKKLPI